MLIAPIAAGSLGGNAVVAGVAGRRIRVIAFLLSFSGSVNAKWQDGTTDVTGLVYGAAGASAPSPALPAAAPHASGPPYQFACSAGAALTLYLSAAVAVGGYVVYELVGASQ